MSTFSCPICIEPFNGGPTQQHPRDRRPVLLECACGQSICMSCAETIRITQKSKSDPKPTRCSFCNVPYHKFVINRALLNEIGPKSGETGEDGEEASSSEETRKSSREAPSDENVARMPKRMEVYGILGYYAGKLNSNGVPHGSGTFTWDDGGKYEGEWVDGEKEGKGIDTYADGGTYEGEYNGGEMEGRGRYTTTDGDVYVGEFRRGMMEGKGIISYAGGCMYEGEWKDCKKEGHGTLTAPDGKMYVGEFREDEIEGHGTTTWANGVVETCVYCGGNGVGEGARWSADRRTAWLLRDGMLEEEISLDAAAAIAGRLGLPVPR